RALRQNQPFLTLFIIGPAYHFMRVVQGGKWYHLVLGSLLTACAMMTKGPVVPIASVGAGIVAHCAFTGQWKELWHPRWLLAALLTALFVSPELYALYQQFDAHPEKIVYGQPGTSGLRFFFWDSQMGRFLNNGPLRGSGDPLFFTHTLLWALLPWAFIAYAAAGRAIIGLFRRQHLTTTPPLPEYLSLGAGISLFILFSASRFQLPHYLNIVFPFYAVLAAHFLSQLSVTGLRRWTIAQTVIALLVGTLVTGVMVLYQPERLISGLIWIFLIALVTIIVFWRYNPRFGNPLATLTGRMVGLMVIVGGLINLFLYPSIMQYQAGMVAADYANTRPDLQRTTWFYGGDTYGESSWSYEYYTKQPTHYIYADSTLKRVTQQGPVQVLTTPVYADSLTKQGFRVRRLATFPYYHVSQLTGTFLNPATRPSTLKAYILAEVQ
ncbi:MAG: glycosyl transferase, partial [Cytophagaceae bacterium]